MIEAALPDPGPVDPAPVHAAGADGGTRRTPPDPLLLAALARACGVPAFAARPDPNGAPGRVWRLRPDSGEAGAGGGPAARFAATGAERILKLDATGLEAHVLAAAPNLGLPAPALLAWTTRVRATPVAAAGTPPAGVAPEGLCLARLSGSPLSEELHAGGAIPVAAWAQAIARVHSVPRTAAKAAIAGLSDLPAPRLWLAERLPQLAAESRRLAPADVGLLLVAACERLPLLAAAGDVEPVFCHGDWAPEHVVVSRGAVSGVADWEHSCIAAPGHDLATAVVGLFARGLSARAALALGDALAAAYAAARGQPPLTLTFFVAALALERAVEAVRRRAAGLPGAEVAAWCGLLGMCLGRG